MLYVADLPVNALQSLLGKYSLEIVMVNQENPIPGSFWGDSEAGLIDNRLYLQDKTPVHSALHEACHYVCMDTNRRENLDTDAGGGYDEENGVCFLQILLAAKLDGCTADILMEDMDSWGYSFRLGSAKAWFTEDAEDAEKWLLSRDLITESHEPTWRLRV